MGTVDHDPGWSVADFSRRKLVVVNGGGGSGQDTLRELGEASVIASGIVTVTVATAEVAEAPGPYTMQRKRVPLSAGQTLSAHVGLLAP